MKNKILTTLSFIVSIQGLAVGAYHLYLPTHWQWSAELTQTPEILRWALLALNDMWSILMILTHATLLYCFREGYDKQRYQLGFLLALYWLSHALIITIKPMPLPQHMQSFLVVIIAIPYLQFLILVIGSWNTRLQLYKSIK